MLDCGTKPENQDRTGAEHVKSTRPQNQLSGGRGGSWGVRDAADLELVEAQREVQDEGELPSQSLFLLQLLRHRCFSPSEDLQEEAETGFYAGGRRFRGNVAQSGANTHKNEEEESLYYPVCEKTRKMSSAWRRGGRQPTRHSSERAQQRDSGWPGTHKKRASKGPSVRLLKEDKPVP